MTDRKPRSRAALVDVRSDHLPAIAEAIETAATGIAEGSPPWRYVGSLFAELRDELHRRGLGPPVTERHVSLTIDVLSLRETAQLARAWDYFSAALTPMAPPDVSRWMSAVGQDLADHAIARRAELDALGNDGAAT
jgi:hypothetical protein